jgi:hypothetical protein
MPEPWEPIEQQERGSRHLWMEPLLWIRGPQLIIVMWLVDTPVDAAT